MMIPAYKISRKRKNERELLAAWLAEREMERVLRDKANPAQPVGLRYDERKKDRVIEPGDVLLLKPAGNWNPTYVLVLEKDGESGWVVVPFGRYSTPAVPGEWSTGFKTTPLRVLCFWNVHKASKDRLIDGPVKGISTKRFEEAISAYQHIFRGDDLADRLEKRLGPPILHPADPRYEYLEEERERLEDHLKESAVPDGEILSFEDSGTNWLMAAEGRPGYGRKKR